MNSFNKLSDITKLFEKGADYLYQNRLCDEDHIPHGRRSYVWPILAWLYRHDKNKKWKEWGSRVAEELDPTVRRDPLGEMIIYPGLQHRRNYSTNAIDCGTFVDSFYDFMEMCGNAPHPLTARVEEIAENYIFKKITGHKDVHDQYLWAATGLARFLSGHPQDPNANVYRAALKDTVDFWLRHHEADGYSPYMNTDPFMGGLTPYYFSRRIAFCWYILEKANLVTRDTEQKLLMATLFLAKLLRPDGTKAMALEAKRYYFWGSYEADSHPFDIYAFSKAFEKTGDEFWLDVSALSLRRLLESQVESGAIRSRDSLPGVRDWQCDIMRTGHLAWLTRIPDEYLMKISSRIVQPISTPYDFKKAKVSDRVLLVGNAHNWIHFVTKKGALAGHAGERCSGLVVGAGNISDLTHSMLFHYRSRGNPLIFLKHSRPAIAATFQYALFHIWDCVYHKRALGLAFAFFKDGFAGFLFTGLFTKSTEFTTTITGLAVHSKGLCHDLVLSDVSGTHTKIIGRREILWDDTDSISIKDTISAPVTLSIRLPKGVEKIRGPHQFCTTYCLA